MKRKSNISNNPFLANRNFFDKNFNHAKKDMSERNYNIMLRDFNRAENGDNKKNELIVYANDKEGAESIVPIINWYYAPNPALGTTVGRYIEKKIKRHRDKLRIYCKDAVSRDRLRITLNNINADPIKENKYQTYVPPPSGSPGKTPANGKTPIPEGGDDNKIKTSKMVLLAGAVLAAILILRN